MTKIYHHLITEVDAVITHGGIVLWCMLGLSVVLYTVLTSTWIGVFRVKKEISALDKRMLADTNHQQVVGDMQLFELERMAWVKRRIPVLSVMIALAPLAGLLGTVSGMLATFSGMADQSTGKPIDAISSGISQALVTTQAGLFMAIPAAILFAMLKSKIEQVHAELEQHVSSKVLELKKALP